MSGRIRADSAIAEVPVSPSGLDQFEQQERMRTMSAASCGSTHSAALPGGAIGRVRLIDGGDVILGEQSVRSRPRQ